MNDGNGLRILFSSRKSVQTKKPNQIKPKKRFMWGCTCVQVDFGLSISHKRKEVNLLATVVEGDQKASFSIVTTPLLLSLDCSTKLPYIAEC